MPATDSKFQRIPENDNKPPQIPTKQFISPLSTTASNKQPPNKDFFGQGIVPVGIPNLTLTKQPNELNGLIDKLDGILASKITPQDKESIKTGRADGTLSLTGENASIKARTLDGETVNFLEIRYEANGRDPITFNLTRSKDGEIKVEDKFPDRDENILAKMVLQDLLRDGAKTEVDFDMYRGGLQ